MKKKSRLLEFKKVTVLSLSQLSKITGGTDTDNGKTSNLTTTFSTRQCETNGGGPLNPTSK
jgi:hypothetical protein